MRPGSGLFFASITFLLFSGPGLADSNEACLKKICPQLVIPNATALELHQQKDSFGPTYAGSEAWNDYLALIEKQATQYDMVDFSRNYFSYQRWFTSDWPDTSGWSLLIGGQKIAVSSYGANSGSTDAAGLTADLVLFPDIQNTDPKGKILVLELEPSSFQKKIPDWIYAPPEKQLQVGHEVTPEETIYQSTVSQLFAANLDGSLPLPGPHYLKLIKQLGVAGAIIIFDMSNARANGLYSFPVPAIYSIPTLYLGRESGRELLQAMKAHSQATLKLEATIESAKAYQLTAFLPGRNYGSDDDEIIMMITHTDGPSISQENGPLGLLGIIHYFSQIEPTLRKKTLMFFLDGRHYIPNREASLPGYDIDKVLVGNGPLAPQHGKIVASVHLEHLGQQEFNEVDGRYQRTGNMEAGSINITGYPSIVDIARTALIDNQPKNQFLRSTDFPGQHCKSQGMWFGLGRHPRKIGIEAIASSLSYMGAYWSTAANIDYLDINQFVKQVNVMTQITGNFMLADVDGLLADKITTTCNINTAASAD